MQKPGIFVILEYSEPFRDWILTHIHNSYLQNQVLCNSENSEPWHIDNPGTLRTMKYLKTNTYSDHVKDLILSIL